MAIPKGSHIDIRLGQAAGRERPGFPRDDAGNTRVRSKWFVAGRALIFFGMLAVVMYATGVYQQGVHPYVTPILAKAKLAWEEWQAKKIVGAPIAPPQPEVTQSHTRQPRLAEPAALQPPANVSESQLSEAPPEKETKRLARVYERMRPKDAALIVEQLEPSLAVEILSQMPDRQAARILGAMVPERAARITARLAERSS